MGLFKKEDIFIVTGASSGIGRQTAFDLIEEGASVVGVARSFERLKKTKEMSAYPENFVIETRDLSQNIEEIDEWIKSLKEKYGKFRGLAYCAGIISICPHRILNLEDMQNMFNINYFTPIMMTKAFLNKKNNIGKGSSIVAISSLASKLCEKGMTTYSGSKAALVSSLRCIAKEVAISGIRINTVSPSDISTPMTMNEEMQQIREEREKMYPLGFGEAKDVSNMIVYLLSDKAKWITAQNYTIDCGII